MLIMSVTIISMLILGWLVWATLQRQEKNDDAFQEKLDADDERARQGRDAYRRGSKKNSVGPGSGSDMAG